MRELFDRHADAWLGPVATVTDPRRRSWARGFLDGCSMIARRPHPDVEPTLGHAAWRTLRVLTAHDTTIPYNEVTRLICETSNLKALYVPQLSLDVIAASAHAPRITELAVAPSGSQLHQLFPLLSAECFAGVRRLHLFGAVPAMLPEVERKDLTLIVITVPGTIQYWLPALDEARSRLTEVRLVSSVFPLLERRGMELVLQPDEDRRWNRLEVRWSEHDEARLRDAIIHRLGQLPVGSLSRLSFVGPPTAQFDVARWKTRVLHAVRHLDLAID